MENLKEKFKTYLEQEFKSIKPTKAAALYRIEMLDNLMEEAQALKIKGMQNDNLVYNTCIDKLGDFQQTLKEFEEKSQNRQEEKKTISKTIKNSIFVLAGMLFCVLIYLSISFVTKAWSKTWLMLLPTAVIGIDFLIFGALKTLKLKNDYKLNIKRIIIDCNTAVLFTFIFLCCQVLGKPGKKYWLIFLALPIGVLISDVIVAYKQNFKYKAVSVLALLPTSSALIYVILNLLFSTENANYWAITIPVIFIGIIIDLIIIGIYSRKKIKAKSDVAKAKAKDLAQEDEKFYTSWDI